MRIIAGRLRGRRLFSPKTRRIRPTAGKVREALFSILGQRVEGARVLDLFAGTGALGLEALSRGAQDAVFVEADPSAARLLKRNIESLGLDAACRVVVADVFRALGIISGERGSFDIVLLDPPYGKGLGKRVLEDAAQKGLIAARGIVAWEHPAKREPIEPMPGFGKVAAKRYGDTALTILEREA